MADGAVLFVSAQSLEPRTADHLSVMLVSYAVFPCTAVFPCSFFLNVTGVRSAPLPGDRRGIYWYSWMTTPGEGERVAHALSLPEKVHFWRLSAGSHAATTTSSPLEDRHFEVLVWTIWWVASL